MVVVPARTKVRANAGGILSHIKPWKRFDIAIAVVITAAAMVASVLAVAGVYTLVLASAFFGPWSVAFPGSSGGSPLFAVCHGACVVPLLLLHVLWTGVHLSVLGVRDDSRPPVYEMHPVEHEGCACEGFGFEGDLVCRGEFLLHPYHRAYDGKHLVYDGVLDLRLCRHENATAISHGKK